MDASSRRAVQTRFMGGSLRVIVATIAFGMGLNKRFVGPANHPGHDHMCG